MRKLSACAPTVNQSISIGLLTCGFGDDVAPEGVREDEDHRDDKAVDGRGLDHGQADEQGPGDGRGGIRLLGQRAKRGGDRPAFRQCGAHRARSEAGARSFNPCWYWMPITSQPKSSAMRSAAIYILHCPRSEERRAGKECDSR